MPLPDLSDHDYNDVAALVREAIDAEPYRVGPRMSKLKRLIGEAGAGGGKADGVPAAHAERAAEPAVRAAEGRSAATVTRTKEGR